MPVDFTAPFGEQSLPNYQRIGWYTIVGYARLCPYNHFCHQSFSISDRGDQSFRRHLRDHAPDNIANGLFGPTTQEELPPYVG